MQQYFAWLDKAPTMQTLAWTVSDLQRIEAEQLSLPAGIIASNFNEPNRYQCPSIFQWCRPQQVFTLNVVFTCIHVKLDAVRMQI